MKNKEITLIFIWFFAFTAVKSQNISINIPSNPPADVSEWAKTGSVFNITVSGSSQLVESRMLVFIRSASGQVVCGNSNPMEAQPTNITQQGAPKVWAGHNAVSLIGSECRFPTGSYELCVQIFGIKNREGKEPDLEKCVPFEIKEFDCTPSNNVSPKNEAVLGESDFLKPVIFNWTPFILPGVRQIQYRLLVWEIEEGQNAYEALYNNFPYVDKIIKNVTNYVAPPGTFEKRSAQYVWRVIAINEKEEPLCNTAQSEPTTFSIHIPETRMVGEEDDSTYTQPDSCCNSIIIDKGNNIQVNPANVAEITQQFNISPDNIRQVSVEIISVEESAAGTNCNECSEHENWIHNFVSHNTASWNGETAWNASPVNGSAYYPAKLIEWHCNKQGDVQFKLKVALPENKSGCIRKTTICLRYKFTDVNCISCDKIICYELTN